jgi:hypothetical protein
MMKNDVCAARYAPQVLQPVIVSNLVLVVDDMILRDRPVCGFPDQMSTLSPPTV